MNKENFNFINNLAQLIFDKKGSNILALDVKGISSICDYLIIAEGNIERHVTAIAHTLIKEMKGKRIKAYHVDGLKEGDWLVIDFGQVHVHLFVPAIREKYNLESLWEGAKIIELAIDTERKEPIGIF